MLTVPKQQILIQFSNTAQIPDKQSSTRQIYGPIEARVT